MLPLSTRKQDAANTLVNYENTILTVTKILIFFQLYIFFKMAGSTMGSSFTYFL